ncbi:MAG: hypothetical protein EOP24_32175 [Hyphomicrobiales bacterium]|nr:MAG: hypothetical protein EOP24_32175 [Hyphomicrobiales bacterium]
MFGSFLTSGLFWVETLERAVKSGAQGALLAVGADQFNVLSLDWSVAAGFAGGAALLSALTSIASGGITDSDSPSLVD